MTYDYIIVGAGSAGCILAERLSASGQYSVLVLEAGGKANSFWFKIPVGFAKTYYDPGCNWMYYTEPEAELADRKLYAPRGKVQGGSGSINAMIYVRGAPRDFDDWAAAGNGGWSYKDVLPYFRKLETHEAGDTAVHGASGPIHVTSMKRGIHAITRHFLDACDELKVPRNDDFNGAKIEGVGVYDVNTHKGQRASSNVAYLEPALKRSNVHIEHHALTSRVLFTDGARRVSRYRRTASSGRSMPGVKCFCVRVRSTRPSCCNSRALARRTYSRATGFPSCTRCLLSARTCRIISARATTIARTCLR